MAIEGLQSIKHPTKSRPHPSVELLVHLTAPSATKDDAAHRKRAQAYLESLESNGWTQAPGGRVKTPFGTHHPSPSITQHESPTSNKHSSPCVRVLDTPNAGTRCRMECTTVPILQAERNRASSTSTTGTSHDQADNNPVIQVARTTSRKRRRPVSPPHDKENLPTPSRKTLRRHAHLRDDRRSPSRIRDSFSLPFPRPPPSPLRVSPGNSQERPRGQDQSILDSLSWSQESSLYLSGSETASPSPAKSSPSRPIIDEAPSSSALTLRIPSSNPASQRSDHPTSSFHHKALHRSLTSPPRSSPPQESPPSPSPHPPHSAPVSPNATLNTHFTSHFMIHSPQPPIPLESPDPLTLLTPSLTLLTTYLPHAHHFTRHLHHPATRTLSPLERGHWHFSTTSYPDDLRARFWSFLRDFITSSKAGWGVWLSAESTPQRDRARRGAVISDDGLAAGEDVKLFCWGGLARELWVVLLVGTERRIKGTGAMWVDSGGRQVLVMH